MAHSNLESRKTTLLQHFSHSMALLGAACFLLLLQEFFSQRAQFKVGLKNPAAFILFLVLENSSKIFDGILLGTALGVFVAVPSDSKLLISCVGLGGALGLSFFSVRKVKAPNIRLGIILLSLQAYVLLSLISLMQHLGTKTQSFCHTHSCFHCN